MCEHGAWCSCVETPSTQRARSTASYVTTKVDAASEKHRGEKPAIKSADNLVPLKPPNNSVPG
eukprot:2408566-Prymnesium_polylepis.1